MRLRKSISSVVTHPNIITSSGENKRWRNRWPVEHPLHHISFKSMLQQNRLFRGVSFSLSWRKWPINSPHTKDVAIFGHHLVLTCFETMLVTDLLHRFESVRIICELAVLSSFVEIGPIINVLLVFGWVDWESFVGNIVGCGESKSGEDKLTGLIHLLYSKLNFDL